METAGFICAGYSCQTYSYSCSEMENRVGDLCLEIEDVNYCLPPSAYLYSTGSISCEAMVSTFHGYEDYYTVGTVFMTQFYVVMNYSQKTISLSECTNCNGTATPVSSSVQDM